MGIGERNNLPSVGRVGENFLVPGHGRVEHHLSNGFTLGAHRQAVKKGAIFKCEDSRRGHIDLPVC